MIAIIVFFLSQIISNLILESIVYKNKIVEIYHPENVYKFPYENVDIEHLELTNSWIEILDESKKVIFVKVKKQDDIYQYNERMLYDYAARHDYNEQYPFYYNVYPIDGPNGEPYLFLWKLPKNMYSEVYNLKVEYLSEKFNSFQITLYGTFISVFLLLFVLSLYVYSRVTSKYIKEPLTHLISGIREMEKENYSTRLNFYAQKEFGEIRNAFNNMVQRLEKIENEKKRIADSKQRMLVDISHDLKTPITSIHGFSKLLYDEDIVDVTERKKYLRFIYNKSHYVSNLIQDLFQLSRLDDENFEFTYKKGDLGECVRQIIGEFYPEFEKKDHLLNISIDEEPLIVNFDRNQMYRAISNILINTIKYNPSGTKVWIECYKTHDKVILKIADDGIGINEDIRNCLFDPFVRGDKSRKNEEGTGLGLAITKKIVERHDGTITLSCTEKGKTVFILQFPLIKTS